MLMSFRKINIKFFFQSCNIRFFHALPYKMTSFFEAHIWPQKGKLFRLAYGWVRDRALAEDVLQNVFEKSVTREKELKNHPNVAAWLVTSLKNEVLMHYRQNQKIDSLDNLEKSAPEDSEEQDTSRSVEKVLKLLSELPVKQREVFQLREVEGLNYEEIAGYLEISLDQVKVNLHRARKSIRVKMLNQKLAL